MLLTPWHFLGSPRSLQDTHLPLDSSRLYYHIGNLCHVPALTLVNLSCNGTLSSLRFQTKHNSVALPYVVQSHLLSSHFHSCSTKTIFQQNIRRGSNTDFILLHS